MEQSQRKYYRIILVLMVLVLLISTPYWFPTLAERLSKQDWTGFGPYTLTETTETFQTVGATTQQESSVVRKFQREKTLWDWIQILIVPLVLAVAGTLIGAVIQRSQQKRSEVLAKIEQEKAIEQSKIERDRVNQQIQIQRDQSEKQLELTRYQINEQIRLAREQAENQAKENLLQVYFKQITELILGIHNSGHQQQVIRIARAHTVSVLKHFTGDENAIEKVFAFIEKIDLGYATEEGRYVGGDPLTKAMNLSDDDYKKNKL